MDDKQEKKRQNEINLLKYINPTFEYIFQMILKDRSKIIPEKDITIKYERKDKNKLIDLPNYYIPKNTNEIEYNIYILSGPENNKYIDENWKFQIYLNSEINELNDNTKKILLKKFHTFNRSIQTLLCLLPLNNTDDFKSSFQMEIDDKKDKKNKEDKKNKGDKENKEKEIEREEKSINIVMKQDKFMTIQLTVTYLTKQGISLHQNILNDNKQSFENPANNQFNSKINKGGNIIINNSKNKKEENNINLSEMIDEFDRELEISNVVKNNIIDLNQRRKIIDNNKINVEKLFSECYEDIENINFRLKEEEIFDIPLMVKENELLDNVKNNFNFGSQNQLINELYEEMEGIEIKDLLRYPPNVKSKNSIENFKIEEYTENKNKNIEFKDLVNDYFQIKQILINKN